MSDQTISRLVKPHTIQCGRLRIDEIQPLSRPIRVGDHSETVAEYAETLRAGARLPEPQIFKSSSKYICADGWLTIQARKQNGELETECHIHEGTARDALLYATNRNGTHGLRLTSAEKRNAVTILLSDSEYVQWSNVRIAEWTHSSEALVRKVREELGLTSHGAKLSRDGVLMNVSNIGKHMQEDAKTAAVAAEAVQNQETKSEHQISIENHADTDAKAGSNPSVKHDYQPKRKAGPKYKQEAEPVLPTLGDLIYVDTLTATEFRQNESFSSLGSQREKSIYLVFAVECEDDPEDHLREGIMKAINSNLTPRKRKHRATTVH